MKPKDFTSHHDAAFFENVKFLREHGLSEELIAKRLGVPMNTLKKRQERHPEEAS